MKGVIPLMQGIPLYEIAGPLKDGYLSEMKTRWGERKKKKNTIWNASFLWMYRLKSTGVERGRMAVRSAATLTSNCLLAEWSLRMWLRKSLILLKTAWKKVTHTLWLVWTNKNQSTNAPCRHHQAASAAMLNKSHSTVLLQQTIIVRKWWYFNN